MWSFIGIITITLLFVFSHVLMLMSEDFLDDNDEFGWVIGILDIICGVIATGVCIAFNTPYVMLCLIVTLLGILVVISLIKGVGILSTPFLRKKGKK